MKASFRGRTCGSNVLKVNRFRDSFTRIGQAGLILFQHRFHINDGLTFVRQIATISVESRTLDSGNCANLPVLPGTPEGTAKQPSGLLAHKIKESLGRKGIYPLLHEPDVYVAQTYEETELLCSLFEHDAFIGIDSKLMPHRYLHPISSHIGINPRVFPSDLSPPLQCMSESVGSRCGIPTVKNNRPTSLIQIASDHTCVLFQIRRILLQYPFRFPPSLRRLLHRANVRKYGIFASRTIQQLSHSYAVYPRSMRDLREICGDAGLSGNDREWKELKSVFSEGLQNSDSSMGLEKYPTETYTLRSHKPYISFDFDEKSPNLSWVRDSADAAFRSYLIAKKLIQRGLLYHTEVEPPNLNARTVYESRLKDIEQLCSNYARQIVKLRPDLTKYTNAGIPCIILPVPQVVKYLSNQFPPWKHMLNVAKRSSRLFIALKDIGCRSARSNSKHKKLDLVQNMSEWAQSLSFSWIKQLDENELENLFIRVYLPQPITTVEVHGISLETPRQVVDGCSRALTCASVPLKSEFNSKMKEFDVSPLVTIKSHYAYSKPKGNGPPPTTHLELPDSSTSNSTSFHPSPVLQNHLRYLQENRNLDGDPPYCIASHRSLYRLVQGSLLSAPSFKISPKACHDLTNHIVQYFRTNGNAAWDACNYQLPPNNSSLYEFSNSPLEQLLNEQSISPEFTKEIFERSLISLTRCNAGNLPTAMKLTAFINHLVSSTPFVAHVKERLNLPLVFGNSDTNFAIGKWLTKEMHKNNLLRIIEKCSKSIVVEFSTKVN
jgi:hypothetical protein